jgi:hypothetical protein
MPQVIAAWVERFAARLIQLQPESTPLDAVRDAVATFRESPPDLTPEEAAEMHAARNEARKVDTA